MALAVRRYGEGPKQALLLHGLSSNAAGWWRLGPDLADRGYTVIAPDLRGHGDSPQADDYSMAAYADDVQALGSNWDLALGHSLGGGVLLELLERDPQGASRVILEDPAVVMRPTSELRQWLVDAYGGEISVESVRKSNPRWHPEDARIKAAALLESSRAVVEQTLDHNRKWNRLQTLATVAVPTLLLGADPALLALIPPEAGRQFAAANPQLSYQMIPNGSHSMHRDEYDAFVGAIDAFLAR